MEKRPTIQDLAREAGVGVATVDRVLHGRANVSERAVRKVAAAAERIGYHASGLIAAKHPTRAPKLRFGFVLHKQGQEFYQRFARQIELAAAEIAGYDVRVRIEHPQSQSPADFAEAFAKLAGTADALAGPSVNHASVDRQIEEISARGTPCFTLLNDYAQGVRRSYFGLDNMRVGRVAGWMIASQIGATGKVAVFVGGNRWHGHGLRETGFRTYLREFAPKVHVLDTIVNLETRQITYEATIDLLDRQPDLRGIYVAGGGMEGAIKALRELRPPGKIALVVNELTEETRRALADRYVVLAIGTPLEALCRDLLRAMVAATTTDATSMRERNFLQPQLYLPESV